MKLPIECSTCLRFAGPSRMLALFVVTMVVIGCSGSGATAGSSAATARQAAGGSLQADEVLATIDGEAVTGADLDELAGDQLALMEFQYISERQRLIEAAVREMVRVRLLDEEAEARGVTTDELIASETAGSVEVTPEEITAFHQQNQSRLGGRSLEELYGQIGAYLQEVEREQALTDFTDELAASKEIVYLVEPFRADIDVEGSPALGPADAPVTFVVFSDFECPYCEVFAQTMQQVKDEYGNRVRVVFRQFPLNIHPNAPKAAEASLCAHEQDKFWEMHDLMFEEQRQLDLASLIDKAERLELDIPEFEACLDSGKFAEQIEADMQAASRMGVDGTPAVFINGMQVVGGAVGFEALVEVIEEEIARLQ
jgi:protein-disulfide isomerase